MPNPSIIGQSFCADKEITGINGEKRGTLRWVSPTDKNKPFLSLKLEHLGILSVVGWPDNPGYVQGELYCEKVIPEGP